MREGTAGWGELGIFSSLRAYIDALGQSSEFRVSIEGESEEGFSKDIEKF